MLWGFPSWENLSVTRKFVFNAMSRNSLEAKRPERRRPGADPLCLRWSPGSWAGFKVRMGKIRCWQQSWGVWKVQSCNTLWVEEKLVSAKGVVYLSSQPGAGITHLQTWLFLYDFCIFRVLKYFCINTKPSSKPLSNEILRMVDVRQKNAKSRQIKFLSKAKSD